MFLWRREISKGTKFIDVEETEIDFGLNYFILKMKEFWKDSHIFILLNIFLILRVLICESLNEWINNTSVAEQNLDEVRHRESGKPHRLFGITFQ